MTRPRTVRGHLLAAVTSCVLAAASLTAFGPGASLAAGKVNPIPPLTIRPALPANVEAACPWTPTAGHPACQALIRTDIAARRSLSRNTDPYGNGPTQLRSAYNLAGASASDGAGETVAIVDLADDPGAEADLAVYRAQYGLPACTSADHCFSKVNEDGQSGNYPAADEGWGEEISLDLDMVSAICPLCHILLVESAGNAGAAEDTAVRLGAKFISNSYGSLDVNEQDFNHPGVAITASTGDYGYAWILPPATFPEVTAVGGTSLLPASNARGWAEIAWSGGGSGCATGYTKPAWQADSGCSARTEADVAAVADPDAGGVAVYDSFGFGGWGVFGGTSAASPIVASVYALAGTPAAGSYPAKDPYEHPGSLYDIVAGTTSFSGCSPKYLCVAGAGYDGPTGLGTPDGVGAFR